VYSDRIRIARLAQLAAALALSLQLKKVPVDEHAQEVRQRGVLVSLLK
jgi:hypothetical protein